MIYNKYDFRLYCIKQEDRMKKFLAVLVAVIMIFSIMSIGCGKSKDSQQGDDVPEASVSAEPTPTKTPYDKTVTFTVMLKDSSDAPISGGQLTVTVGAETFSGTADSEGKLSIDGLPATQRMTSKITDSSGTQKAGFLLSLWPGYDLESYSNEDYVSIDIESSTTTVYAVLKATEDGFAQCDYVSVDGFKEETTPGPSGSAQGGEGSQAPSGTASTMYVNSSGVNVRSEANATSNKVTSLNIGTEVTVTDNGTPDGNNTWYAVTFTQSGSEKSGYIRGDFLSAKVMKVAKDGVNLRSSATTSSSVVGKLSKGTNLYLLDEGTKDGEYTWYKISCVQNGKSLKGYIRDDLIEN